jgi:hypothetical protein
MRLLNTTTLKFREFQGDDIPQYAILSHCWSHATEQEEASYHLVTEGRTQPDSYGWQKVIRCCDLARSRALGWAWIDTICIDRASSAELSEAINSMYSWYKRSTECYAFLDDVKWLEAETQSSAGNFASQNWQNFGSSRWFSRGWTLQELLAPTSVLFYTWDGVFIGSKSDLARCISEICGIGVEYLRQIHPVTHASVARRMSWAANRKTTRPEDIAYSLLGIFDINMPLLYGEGQRAFLRLQLAIMDRSDDDSILAWNIKPLYDSTFHTCTGVLARSPDDFSGSADVARTALLLLSGNRHLSQPTQKAIEFRSRVMPIGLRRHLAVGIGVDSRVQFVTLACQMKRNGRRSHLTMALIRDVANGTYYRTGLHLHGMNRFVNFLCYLTSREILVHLAPNQSSSEFIVNEFENEVIASVHSRHLAGRAVVIFLCRISVVTLALNLTTVTKPDETEVQLVMMGFLLGARAVGSVVFCLLWLVFKYLSKLLER